MRIFVTIGTSVSIFCAGFYSYPIFAMPEIRQFINSLARHELESVAKPYPDSIRLKMKTPFVLSSEASGIRCSNEEFNRFTSSVDPEIAISAIKIMGVVSFEEDIRSIDYFKNIESLALKKNQTTFAEKAHQISVSLETERASLESAITRNLEGVELSWKNKIVRYKAAAAAPNCLGLFNDETVQLSHKWNLALIGNYLVNKLNADQSLVQEVAKKQSCAPISMDASKPWLKYFRSSLSENWKDPWSRPLDCKSERGMIMIRSYGKSGLERNAVDLGKVTIPSVKGS